MTKRELDSRRERWRIYAQHWRQANRQRYNAYQRAWRLANPERVQAYRQRYRRLLTTVQKECSIVDDHNNAWLQIQILEQERDYYKELYEELHEQFDAIDQ